MGKICTSGLMEANAATDLQPPQMANPEKTPIQILHEYGTKTDSLPVYELEKAEGTAHQPTFIFNVTVGEITCTGQGFSKKAAKHRAAEAALKLLQVDCGSLAHIETENNGLSETSDQPNSVGILQELALQRAWHLPEYIVVMETGPVHRRQFTVTCRLESLSETGTGNSKKTAKKNAAERILAKLQTLSGSTEITWTPKPRVYLENLRNSTQEKVSLLRTCPLSIPNTDYVQMMADLSQEQGFDVTYYNVDELTVNGQYQCLAEMSTQPVTVYHGTGISRSNAYNDAAHSALQYIKIMASMK
ncbi:interferon-inducible double-stranded RNA-dependent protein kinase activator A homolog isoform X2 [Denticeps clupeoides]|uniref:interferon-inducible double-stranded RNA-dependent protein kinase activator A homolog isoform X2 n=1 Tax=Denticeps clupeoides TaxID=299321 RepID=UPI0010A53280|nr:interferon-inducible double-stranded RNA-dependent protein kinase activator A isoform X2 [Denticeps clupeoides]